MGTLQRNLIPRLEECWERLLTEKEQQLVSILELLHIEKFAGRPVRRFGRKPWERQALARAFVGKAVYNHPHTRATIEALRASPVFRRTCGFVRRADVPSESTFSRAFAEFWHADVSDCCLPISVALTAASLHDSQVAIPLMKLTSERVDYLYDLMDAAYDAQPIYAVSRSLGHVPLIDKNGRGQEVIPLAPHEAARYKERTVAERFNSRLKEEFGGDNVMVRGAQKVGLHLMFGVIALFADQLLKLIN
jgi:hypothetical protein